MGDTDRHGARRQGVQARARQQGSGVPHDIVIKDQAGAQVFKTEVVTGPKAQVFDAPSSSPARIRSCARSIRT